MDGRRAFSVLAISASLAVAFACGDSATNGDGAPAPVDGGNAVDAQDASDANDGRVPIPCPYDTPMVNYVECIAADASLGFCSSPLVCCLGPTTNTCTDDAPSCPDTPLRCSGRSSCNAPDDCCLTTTRALTVFDACPPILERTEITKTECASSCGGYRACRTNGECQDIGKLCRRLRVKSAKGNIELGVCL